MKLERLVIPEGTMTRKIASDVQTILHIDSTLFMERVRDDSLSHALGLDAGSCEGYLYPDTYFFPQQCDPDEVISTMVRHFFTMVGEDLLARADSMGMTLHQVVTLASIIEGEAVLDEERGTISAIYHNRLKKRMYLDSCPTIQYLIPDGPRRLLDRDLEIDSPYNTYLHFGLPPGPVNNPGIQSIKAALYPADTDLLYMVANGDGSHTFSRTLHEHLQAKKRFDQLRRMLQYKNK